MASTRRLRDSGALQGTGIGAAASGAAGLVELITHLAFYGGWPSAISAMARAHELLGPKEPELTAAR